jgi:hypothetical protein
MQDPTPVHLAIKSHRHYVLVYVGGRLSRLLLKVNYHRMEQFVEFIR